jgi:hypothetical protein
MHMRHLVHTCSLSWLSAGLVGMERSIPTRPSDSQLRRTTRTNCCIYISCYPWWWVSSKPVTWRGIVSDSISWRYIVHQVGSITRMTGCITTLWKRLCKSTRDSTPVHHLHVNTSRTKAPECSSCPTFSPLSEFPAYTDSKFCICQRLWSSALLWPYSNYPSCTQCPLFLTACIVFKAVVLTYNVRFVSSCSTAQLHVPYNYHETHTDGHWVISRYCYKESFAVRTAGNTWSQAAIRTDIPNTAKSAYNLV